MQVVLATGNSGKVTEIREIVAAFGWQVVPQTALGVLSAEETGTTLAENALIKARHAAQQTGLAAMADDSGLMVDALNGAPGVYSARFAGPSAGDEENNAKLLSVLATVDAPRSARYQCVMAFVEHANDLKPVLAYGSWEGFIATQPRGTGGFGYDPLFIVAADPEQRTAAELLPAIKNRISHRAQALVALSEALQKRMTGFSAHDG